MSVPKATRTRTSLLEEFLGDNVLVSIKDMDVNVSTEEGEGIAPMMLQGVFVDFDDTFILLSDEGKTTYSLVNINSIAKIDIINAVMEEMLNPDRPKVGEMN